MKVTYDGKTFDSELEIEYYKHLKDLKITFIYHPAKKIQVTKNNVYTPDFIAMYDDRIEIIETKGYNQFSFQRDNMIHNFMKEQNSEVLEYYVEANGIEINNRKVIYKKIKFLKAYGWVDFDFKNPNTLANARKHKIEELAAENKELKKQLKAYERYLSYMQKKKETGKLSKIQKEWLEEFCQERGI